MHPQAGPFAGHPGGQLVTGQDAPAVQPLVVETAQPAPGDALPVTARDPAFRGPGQRAGPRGERRNRLGPVLAPGALMPEAQAGAVQIAFTAGHRAVPRTQRAGGPRRRRGVKIGPAQARVHPGAAAPIAAPGRAARRSRASRGAARPRRGPCAVQVAGEQQGLAVPFAGAPGRVQPGTQPPGPALGIVRLAAGPVRDGPQRASAHRYRFPAATASTARRLSSSRACR